MMFFIHSQAIVLRKIHILNIHKMLSSGNNSSLMNILWLKLLTIILGQEKAIQKSKYEEDVYINNHTVSLC